ncbi:cysteine desulfurase family protein [Thalassotalea mangrovi]|uniref:cysteine desulfurase n=1 Tax=Thalassotalea mangrovi TaxID=2572245 RepID=A0A4U1B7B5_9GAMM|nr:cysteine desulfurase family protein [Thalassotalea mangrovi]TKB46340.1 cysteine desulfurase [Thalassotalea mangrovi]
MIYLDTAASYPLLPEVKDTLSRAFTEFYANSASNHFLGEIVSQKIEGVRELLADEIGAYPSEIIFTSGATESNNIALKSTLLHPDFPKDKKHIVTTQIEHKCMFAICSYLETLEFDVTYIAPNKSGVIEASKVKEALRPDTALVSVMHVNNELGTINPIAEIGEACFNAGVLFHSDAAQSFQKVGIDVDELNVDLMSFSAHKIGGPKGIGAIYIRDLRQKHLTPVVHGAGQEAGLRGGTVAAPLIIGFGKAIELFSERYRGFSKNEIKSKFLDLLKASEINFQVNGLSNSLPHCLSLTLPKLNSSKLIRANERILCLAQGSACSSKEIEASHVLTAIGLNRGLADKTFRISFPLDVKEIDLNIIVDSIKKASLEI